MGHVFVSALSTVIPAKAGIQLFFRYTGLPLSREGRIQDMRSRANFAELSMVSPEFSGILPGICLKQMPIYKYKESINSTIATSVYGSSQNFF